ncbi:DUF4232 domain-containing protein [Amycolatopsis cihanbeyliensis]|uniref:Uncharacterized protein DUF4232 n=1 Tax=Amycolatopsis cihanbeyliensis TaxID=1128664 RepID=A0A542DK67_AMYCI|nr:DUF4232 domain-containing protein [Amycolatopsis cihanbeyliensis]TQJ03476.1 uncharacterized protein DUF4232 [Amycolatopsis cihanbeyliensis]
MTTRSTIRRTAAALAVAGVIAGISIFSAGAAGAEPAVFECTANQVDTKLVYGGAGMGSRHGAVEFTARQGERCVLPATLPVGVTGAPDVRVRHTAPDDVPAVRLSNGSPAYVPLHWTAIAPAGQQQTPETITVTAPSDSNPHGDHIDPEIGLDWSLGGIDATPRNHTIEVGAVTAGSAPSV